VKRVFVLWHGDAPIGICIFATPARAVALRSQFFRLQRNQTSLALSALNEQLWVLQRVVLHPTYRGAGLAAAFVRRACELCPVPWIETLSAMGRVNPFFERAGFRKLGVVRKRTRHDPTDPYRFSEPAYFIRDNRLRS